MRTPAFLSICLAVCLAMSAIVPSARAQVAPPSASAPPAQPPSPPSPQSLTAISPIFGQIVMFAYPVGFNVVHENASADRYIREAVPAGETIEKWTEMITVTGAKGLAANPNLTPLGAAQALAGGFQKSCPDTFVAKPLGGTKYGGFDAFLALASCGAVKSDAAPRSETALIITIKGAEDFYTIQWAERGAASETALTVDDTKWLERYKRVGPIRLCPIVPGETAPFPSCVTRK